MMQTIFERQFTKNCEYYYPVYKKGSHLAALQTDDKGQFFETVLCFCVNFGIIGWICFYVAENR